MLNYAAMKEIAIAKKAARQAGALLISYLGHLKDVQYKAVRDPVSEADKASEALIAGIIKAAFPAHGFLAEEKTAWDGDGEARWIVDPLDGTVNYAHTYPCFCVSIALEVKGEVVLGVVYDPVRREMFSAVKGKGAYLGRRRLGVSKNTELIRSLVVTGFPYDSATNPGRLFQDVEAMVKASEGVRRDGSAALDLCYVASGRFDGFWELRLKPWDTAAGMLILLEAGGMVTDYSGRPYRIDMPEILATNGKIHGEMMEVLGV